MALKHKDHPNVKIVWYEEMKNDLAAVLKDVSEFLGDFCPFLFRCNLF